MVVAPVPLSAAVPICPWILLKEVRAHLKLPKNSAASFLSPNDYSLILLAAFPGLALETGSTYKVVPAVAYTFTFYEAP